MKKILSLSKLILITIFLALPLAGFAEDQGHHEGGGNSGNGIGNGGGGSTGGGGATAPLDGGVSLLVAAGLSYGAKKIASRKKAADTKAI